MFKISKLIFLASIFIFGLLEVNAQISYGGLPPSFNNASLNSGKDGIKIEAIPVNFSVDKLKSQDAKDRETVGRPPRVAEGIDVNLNMKNSGEWSVLPDGKRVWRLRIKADGALAILLSYKNFNIAEGDSLFIYNIDKTHILGAYTKNTNPKGGSFSTEMVAGDDIVLEYLETQKTEEKGNIVIDKIGYCYNNITVKYSNSEYSTYAASSCMININCEEGDDWQTEKTGVTRMLMYLSVYSGWYVCSGTMINNTSQDLTPYLLSAFHCYDGSTTDDLSKWQFYFHYEASGCTNSTPLGTKTLVGCYFRAATPTDYGSDGLLLELASDIPVDWNVYFNGWDRRNQIVPGRGVGIHHPDGDLKKISTFDNYVSDTWPGAQKIPGADNGHWSLQFISTKNGLSVVEGGSSGSPLFSHEHLVIGTLTGGNSSCSSPLGYNMYGKLWYHWDQYGNSTSTQMRSWLDPIGSGAETLVGVFLNPTAPRITVTKDSIAFEASSGVYSSIDTVIVNGYNLTEQISATVIGVFQISKDLVEWGSELSIPTEGDTIYVRYAPPVIGEHAGILTITNPESGLKQIRLRGSSCLKINITDKNLPAAEIGDNYTFTLNATGSRAPYTFNVVSGNLPAGITLNNEGVLAGIPNASGIYTFTVRISDSYGCSSEEEVSIYIKCYVVELYPFIENFDLGYIPSCWDQEYKNGNLSWIFQSGARSEYDLIQQAYDGAGNATFYDDTYDANATKLITPQLNLSALVKPTVSFWYAMPAWLGEQDIFNLYYKTSALGDWVLLKSYTTDVPYWTKDEIVLPNTSSEYFLAFEAESHFGYGVLLDKLSVIDADDSSIDGEHEAVFSYENPFTNTLTLTWDESIETIVIYGLDGKKVFEVNDLKNLNSLNIQTQAWSRSVYLVNATGNRSHSIFKIVKK